MVEERRPGLALRPLHPTLHPSLQEAGMEGRVRVGALIWHPSHLALTWWPSHSGCWCLEDQTEVFEDSSWLCLQEEK